MASQSTGKDLVIRKRDLVRKKFHVSYNTKKGRNYYGDPLSAMAGAQAGRNVSVRHGIEGSAKAKQRRLT